MGQYILVEWGAWIGNYNNLTPKSTLKTGITSKGKIKYFKFLSFHYLLR